MPDLRTRRRRGLDSGKYTFTQFLSPELLTDGGLEIWTSPTDLTNWNESVSGTSTTNKESSIVHSGSFAARADVDSSNSFVTIRQVIAVSVGDLVEITSWRASNPTAKISRIDVDALVGSANTLTASYQQFYGLMRVAINNPNLQLARAAAASSSLYWDDISAKKITPNAQQTAVADGTINFTFTLPASPLPGQSIHRYYRCAVATPTLDGWDLYLKRNDTNSAWELFVDSVVSGVPTPRKGPTAVSANPTGLRVVLAGDLHDHYTFESGSWTIRGAQVNNATFQTNTIINTVYNTGFSAVSSGWT